MSTKREIAWRDEASRLAVELSKAEVEVERLRAAIVDMEAALSRHHRGMRIKCMTCQTPPPTLYGMPIIVSDDVPPPGSITFGNAKK